MKIARLLTLLIALSFSPPSSSQTNTISFPLTFADDPPTKLPVVLVKIGTPAQTLRLLPDTSSDISWFFCDAFDHAHSESFSWTYTNDLYDDTVLDYTVEYTDGSWVSGDWATETITATSHDGSDAEIEDVRFGCTDRSLSNITDPVDGILALSRNSPSFVTQMTEKFGGRFSYAMREGGKLVFGTRASHATQRYAGLADSNSSFFYKAKISSLSMGDMASGILKVWDVDAEDESGRAVFDTGSTMTDVPQSAFIGIGVFLADYFGDDVYLKVTETKICFAPYSRSFEGLRLPELRFEFEGGSRFAPKVENLYYENGEGLTCFNVRPVDESEGFLIGSLLQEGFLWEYDLSNSALGFAPLD